MESISSLQKQTVKGFILFAFVLITSVEIAEIVNFIYLTPFVLIIIFFLNSAETELHQTTFYFILPFIFGLISDIIALKGTFLLCIAFPILSYITSYLVKVMAFNKKSIFFIYCLSYSAFLYLEFNTPLWVSLLVLTISFLQWNIVSHIISRILSEKHSGETR